MTDTTPEGNIIVRFIMSARDSGKSFDLRCHVRENVVRVVTERWPECLVNNRIDVGMWERKWKKGRRRGLRHAGHDEEEDGYGSAYGDAEVDGWGDVMQIPGEDLTQFQTMSSATLNGEQSPKEKFRKSSVVSATMPVEELPKKPTLVAGTEVEGKFRRPSLVAGVEVEEKFRKSEVCGDTAGDMGMRTDGTTPRTSLDSANTSVNQAPTHHQEMTVAPGNQGPSPTGMMRHRDKRPSIASFTDLTSQPTTFTPTKPPTAPSIPTIYHHPNVEEINLDSLTPYYNNNTPLLSTPPTASTISTYPPPTIQDPSEATIIPAAAESTYATPSTSAAPSRNPTITVSRGPTRVVPPSEPLRRVSEPDEELAKGYDG